MCLCGEASHVCLRCYLDRKSKTHFKGFRENLSLSIFHLIDGICNTTAVPTSNSVQRQSAPRMGLQMVSVARRVILGVHIPYPMSALENFFKNKILSLKPGSMPVSFSLIRYLPFSHTKKKRKKEKKRKKKETQLSHFLHLKDFADQA